MKIPSQKEIRAAAIEYAEDMCKMFEPGTETEKYCKNDFIAGAQWAISQVQKLDVCKCVIPKRKDPFDENGNICTDCNGVIIPNL
jgi:hypothetical protein